MLTYTVCNKYAALTGGGAVPFDDLCVSVGEELEGGRVALYRIDSDGEFSEQPLIGGRAVFDSEFIRSGGDYIPRFFDSEGREYRASSFSVRTTGSGSLIALRRREGLGTELSDIWNVMVYIADLVKENKKVSDETRERVIGLIDGYRTE